MDTQFLEEIMEANRKFNVWEPTTSKLEASIR